MGTHWSNRASPKAHSVLVPISAERIAIPKQMNCPGIPTTCIIFFKRIGMAMAITSSLEFRTIHLSGLGNLHLKIEGAIVAHNVPQAPIDHLVLLPQLL